MAQRKRKLDLGPSNGVSAATVAEDLAKARINPWTGRPYSPKYYEILRKRQTLPVFQYLDELLRMVRSNQVVVVEGETGSGKTTQVGLVRERLLFETLSHERLILNCTTLVYRFRNSCLENLHLLGTRLLLVHNLGELPRCRLRSVCPRKWT